MTKLRGLVGLCAALALGVWVASAVADPNVGPPICPGGGATETAIAGSYGNLTITGNRFVASGTSLIVSGNLTVAPGACLDAFTMGTVHVRGNLLVRPGALLALGCTINSIGPEGSPCTGTTNDTVDGSLIADHALTMYLDGNTIHGNLFSDGGGPGLTGPFINFPIKDNTIDGNLTVQGWKGGWAGLIRDTVGGNVVFSKNGSVQDPDSNEVQTNVITGNLTCKDNSPAAQVNPADGGLPNTVGGQKIGQCAGL